MASFTAMKTVTPVAAVSCRKQSAKSSRTALTFTTKTKGSRTAFLARTPSAKGALARRARSFVVRANAEAAPSIEWTEGDPNNFSLGILGDLHVDPRDLEHTYLGRDHMKAILKDSPNPFLVSLGDLGESKDCTESKQLYAGTTECFKLVRGYLDGFECKYDIVGGNHDLEGIDEFQTDEENLEAYLSIMGKDTPQFCHEVAPKVLVVGLGSTAFRTAPYTSHEVACDIDQINWFVKTIEDHPAEEGWQIFCFSHAPIIGSALRVLQECHVVNGCCWLNHNDKVQSKRYIETVRANPQIKGWFSGHFHLSHDYEDSITFPGGNNRGSCVFAQTGVMTARSTRDGRRHSRFVRGNKNGFEICTVDHGKGGVLRLDATVTYSDACDVDENMETSNSCSVVTFAHKHEDYDHDLWFSAYVPKSEDGCYVDEPQGTLDGDFSSRDPVCWWHMKDGAVLGGHNGMIIEYDPSTLAPLGMVVSRDELEDRKVAVIDDEWGGDALILYSDDDDDVTVVQPNEDGSYWRKVVRNKMHRMREMRRMSAAKNYMKELKGEDSESNVLSSYGPYITTAGQVMGITTRAVNPKAIAYKQ
ncbi:hypothetical protein CYMTET_35827 [Cymbomonas tetramitiformis]|uniref:Calcineurin-like phosphoesterase domain-containing protein n=1 Tax=Cymbomonas tetramitiformis TaxID=36881 RepID=A0AAE0F8H7_9CHLO|nr:hypothetical protein CYMTET_35827 [Cymbomonas tetramitiformis]|eukprot:gene12537-14817_t